MITGSQLSLDIVLAKKSNMHQLAVRVALTLAQFGLLASSQTTSNSTNILDEIDARKFNQLVDMVYRSITTGYAQQEFKKRIQKYGCHCFPNSNTEIGGVG